MTLWTEADQAELDVLIGELLAACERHLAEGCTGCRRGSRTAPRVETVPSRDTNSREPVLPSREDIEWPSGPVERYKPASRPARTHIVPGSCCPKIVAGVHVLLDWREARIRRSRAEWLRAELDALDWYRAYRLHPDVDDGLPGIVLGLEDAA